MNVSSPSDPFDLARFLHAQEPIYEQALAELRSGRKQTHWMWFIFPQYEGLGYSATAQRYSIKSVAEAEAYLQHPILGPRLREFAAAVVEIEHRTAHEIFGSPDDLKLRSCATLFAAVSPAGSEFEQLLRKYYGGAADTQTYALLGGARPG
ncbi:MAG: DUF1810 domain-containing protein [Planctomycetaceae bacterium]|nr:DUF1810 domain-containing protein [Planctomycetaceae bacterium]